MARLLVLLYLTLALPAPADEPPPEAVLATLPFLDYPEPSRIVVDLAPVNARRRLRFILDTGATHSVATPLAAKELGIKVRRHKQDPYMRKTLLGRDVRIHVDTRTSDTGSKTGWEYALLGGQFLGEYVLELDFPNRRVRLLDRRRYGVPEEVDADDEAVLPLVVRGNRPGVEIQINDEKVLALIDTGAPPPLDTSRKVADEAGLPPSELAAFETGSVLGNVRSELRRVEELRLGPFEFENLPAVVSDHGIFNLGMPGDTVIGYELLAHFVVRIDYGKRRLWLKRDPDAKRRFAGREYERYEDLLQPPEPAPADPAG